jgi:uncharacterized protein (DUF934 family)
MGHVIKDHSVSEDPWQYLSDDAPLGEGDIVVTLERWLSESENLIRHQGRIGVELRTDDDIQRLVPSLGQLNLVVITVPAIGDGRCYSLARLLRMRHGYPGELRARGEFLIDQLQFMRRCGFNAFDPAGIGNPNDALRALGTFSVFYQNAADREIPASALRSRERASASCSHRMVDAGHHTETPARTPVIPRLERSAPPLPGQGRERPAPPV